MKNEQARSRILSKLLAPRTGAAILVLSILLLTIAAAGAQGTGVETTQTQDGRSLSSAT